MVFVAGPCKISIFTDMEMVDKAWENVSVQTQRIASELVVLLRMNERFVNFFTR